ncbi:Phosphopantothenate--cysteine ligase [Frankliniella fusca]|uniref:Phosphopantothenate--cysteine ligase n=1 Tax=Frankliniella fusca TaxID=407009 RepID=A0AAE1L7I0_9NEOP|nr:Phosphopantothenate--cysteine ligase [Frankliniella fusca]
MPLTWEQFYAENPPPSDLEQTRHKVENFCRKHLDHGSRIVLITSGGTTVPLEHHTVRFVDNFSAGTRGSASAEYFLEIGYSVIFLYRLKSIEPYLRHVAGAKFLDMLEVDESSENPTISVKSSEVQQILPVLRKYKAAQESQKFLQVGFTTLSDYLWLLKTTCEFLPSFGSRAMLYLAAAVSDFYVPATQMPTHKIQSQDGAPTIQLDLVPKVLQPLVSLWVPDAFVISFKLETDENILIKKARGALSKYKHKIVLANLMDTRRSRVVAVTPDDQTEIILTEEQTQQGLEIEKCIVDYLKEEHTKFIVGSTSQ